MTNPPDLTAAILIVSDTASVSPSTDATTAALLALFNAPTPSCTWRVLHTKIVPDNRGDIQDIIAQWCNQGLAVKESHERPKLVVTAGGTGFATRDITPEAVSPLLDRTAPGIV